VDAALSLDPTALRTLLRELATEARTHRFEVAPNPCVGAAVLARGRVVARGYHRVWGGPHAEVDALAAAREAAAHDGGVPPEEWEALVVTLEPCSTRGKTGSCTEAILATDLKHVVVGAVDPDPRHRGEGLELLRVAGLEVHVLEGASPLEEASPEFLRWTGYERLRRPRPWVIAKWAQTLTGQLSPPEGHGDGRTISGPESHDAVQVLRGRVDAILTGVGTVLADDPRLTVRPPGDAASPPARLVLDSALRTSPEARLFADDPAGGPVFVLTQMGPDPVRARALTEAGATIVPLRGTDRQHLDLREVHTWMWEQGFRRVLLEAGPEMLEAHLEEGFVDQVQVVTGGVRGGRGTSLGSWLVPHRLLDRRDSERGDDAVLEAFWDAS
jgi:diaminohydroxyphosphoribosylaminopyrimidine deaminase/5-amino-6-(5-phosphoribosylamino)uracil reductase